MRNPAKHEWARIAIVEFDRRVPLSDLWFSALRGLFYSAIIREVTPTLDPRQACGSSARRDKERAMYSRGARSRNRIPRAQGTAWFWSLVILGMAVIVATASADTLVTKSGHRWQGKVIEKGSVYVLIKPNGSKMRFPKSVVTEVITAQALRAEFAKRRKELDLANDGDVSKLADFAKDKGLARQREKLLDAAYALRRAKVGKDAEAWQRLADWCSLLELRKHSDECRSEAVRLKFGAQLAKLDLGDDREVAELAQHAQKIGLLVERQELLAKAFALRRQNAGEDRNAWLKLATWCEGMDLRDQRDECQRRAQQLEFREKLAHAGDDPTRMQDLAKWCEKQRLTDELAHCTKAVGKCVAAEYGKRRAKATTPDGRWQLAKWSDQWNLMKERDENQAAAIAAASASGDLARLGGWLGELEAGNYSTGVTKACAKAVYGLRLKSAGKDPLGLAGLAKWCREHGFKVEAKQREAEALRMAPDDADVRKALGYMKDASGHWVRSLLKPIGFYVARSLQGGLGTTGGSIKPKEANKSFLVIVVSAASRHFMPSEAEYLAIKEARKDDSKRKPPPSRECVRVFDPDSFMVVLADGRGYRADLLANWEHLRSSSGFGGFCPGSCTTTSTSPIPLGTAEELAVAWVLNAKDCRMPLKVQFGRWHAVQVPNKRLEPPPVRSSPF